MKSKELKVVLRRDDDSHWYLIPASEAPDFDLALSKIEGQDYMDCPDDFDDFSEAFEIYRTGGSSDLVPDYYYKNGIKPVL